MKKHSTNPGKATHASPKQQFRKQAIAATQSAVEDRTMPAKAIRINKQPVARRPTHLEVEEELNEMIDGMLGELARWVETARAIWRKWPALIEEPEFPAGLRGPYGRMFKGGEPRDGEDNSWQQYVGTWDHLDPMDPKLREKLRPAAEESVAERLVNSKKGA
jgi:hypothetical protein